MNSLARKITSLLLPLLPLVASAAPLTIDLTTPVPPAAASPYGPGATKDPQGDVITADSRSFFLDGKPWIPVAGEFHYSRYPRAEWREELLKMKAGGVNVVSTYVFWIHQEEVQGTFDWTGQRSLRDFLQLCKDLGLKAFVRMGPWCDGEVRNGGFPDWVQNSGARLRSTDPAFLKLVEPLFQEEAKQMQGLLWKDGGPVIGVQMDNETGDGDYLLALKKMAQSAGVDVPYYAATAWSGPLPGQGLLPLYGGYAYGYWGASPEDYRKEFIFADTRAHNDLEAQLANKAPAGSQILPPFPYACVEVGAGMASSYTRRVKIAPEVVAALALTKLGSGNNLAGYYMYHGGINPDGKLSTLEEDQPNPMPVKDYDYQAPLGACGEVRDQLHLLLEQNMLLEEFGPLLARMPAYFPDRRPASLTDFDTLRWSARSDGTSGFLFYSNQQPDQPLPEHKGIQFQLKTNAGTLVIPHVPVNIPPGGCGIIPFNLDCDGVTLQYATAQPLCRVVDQGIPVYFFAALDGLVPDFVFSGNVNHLTDVVGAEASRDEARGYLPNSNAAAWVVKTTGGAVGFVVLTQEQSRHLWLASCAGKDRLILSNATVLTDGSSLRLQSDIVDDLAMSMFPPVPGVKMGITPAPGAKEWIFKHYALTTLHQPDAIDIGVTQLHPAGPNAATLTGTDEAAWKDAAVYKLDIPASAANHHVTLDIHYIGDAARLYIGDKLCDDNYCNGDPFAIGLWRIPAVQWPAIRLKILPYSEALASRLPDQARQQATTAKGDSSVNEVTVTASEQLELSVDPQ
jgi:hypothetical protein